MKKFKVGQEVVYHPGNWHYEVREARKDGSYLLACIEDSDICEDCQEDEGKHTVRFTAEKAKDLMDYEEYTKHGLNGEGECDICT